MRPLPLLVLVFVGAALSQAPSPCEHILRYEPMYPRKSDRWHAVLNYNTTELDGAVLRLEFDNPDSSFINWYGGPTSQGENGCSAKNADHNLPPGKLRNVKVSLRCNQAKKIPSVTKIRLNGAVICPSHNQPQIAPVTPPTYVPTVSKRPLNDLISDIFALQTVSGHQCGTVPLTGRPLVYNGEKAEEGRWPWHLAIQKLTGASLAYSCGGTLISDHFAVTAAHCVVRLPTKILLNPQVFLIQLGTNDLRNGGVGLQNLQASKIFVHPGFDPRRFYNDIALIKFTRRVEFTDYVQPVCLWQGDDDIRHIQGQLGMVVGWGIDGTNKTTTELMEAKIPIVSLSTCIYSNRDFYSQYTSESTYCAGFTNGTTVCRGDSGGGMFFPRDNPGKQSWQLRGVVSVSPNPGTRACATDSYVVFTDVAKHLTWIQTTAQLV